MSKSTCKNSQKIRTPLMPKRKPTPSQHGALQVIRKLSSKGSKKVKRETFQPPQNPLSLSWLGEGERTWKPLELPKWGPAFFFWTKLRASLQQWKSLSCARIVIVRQRDQKERSGTMKDKANQPPNNKQQKPPVPDQSSKRWNKLRLSRQSTIPGSHNVFSRK